MGLATAARRESSEDRRAAIAQAARQLIAEKGFEGLRTRDIAERVGINIATLHYHVPSKEALISLVAETLKDEFRAQVRVRPRAHLSARERFEHELHDFYETWSTQPETIALVGELLERARRDPLVQAAVGPMQRHWQGMIADVIADGKAEGSFRPDIDPQAAATIMVGALIQFWRNGDLSNDSYNRLSAELRRFVRKPE